MSGLRPGQAREVRCVKGGRAFVSNSIGRRARIAAARPAVQQKAPTTDQRIRRVGGWMLLVSRKEVRLMSIVMGLDQHRAQVTAEWIDLVSGEISRARVRPADRVGGRRFLGRFAG